MHGTPNIHLFRDALLHEAFMRRAATIEAPFVLKGSYAVRTFYRDQDDRFPDNAEWLYTGEAISKSQMFSFGNLPERYDISDVVAAEFKQWVDQVVAVQMDDGIEFSQIYDVQWPWDYLLNLSYNEVPEMMINVIGVVNGYTTGLEIYLHFALPINGVCTERRYLSVYEGTLNVRCAPFEMLLIWEIREYLLSPSFNNLLDIIHLISHPLCNRDMVIDILVTVINDCDTAEANIGLLRYFIEHSFEQLYNSEEYMRNSWMYWRFDYLRDGKGLQFSGFVYWQGVEITNVHKLPENLNDFFALVAKALDKVGLNQSLLYLVPEPISNSSSYMEYYTQKEVEKKEAEERAAVERKNAELKTRIEEERIEREKERADWIKQYRIDNKEAIEKEELEEANRLKLKQQQAELEMEDLRREMQRHESQKRVREVPERTEFPKGCSWISVALALLVLIRLAIYLLR